MSFAIKAGEELGIPEVQFWTASACGFMGYVYSIELVKRGILPFKGIGMAEEDILTFSYSKISHLLSLSSEIERVINFLHQYFVFGHDSI
ncbi:hypothetical protein ACB092_02G225800 [Castanea dentata]